MNPYEYIHALFVEMHRRMPENTPLLRVTKDALIFQMVHPFADWPEWHLTAEDFARPPAELADILMALHKPILKQPWIKKA